jgi:hypothetical protein
MSEWPYGTILKRSRIEDDVRVMVVADDIDIIQMTTIRDGGGFCKTADGYYDFGGVWQWKVGRGEWEPVDAED